MSGLYERISTAIMEGDADKTVSLVQKALDQGLAMAHTIKAIEEAGLRTQVKIMVGGAPVDAAFAERIGADGYGSNAPSGVNLAKQLAGVA